MNNRVLFLSTAAAMVVLALGQASCIGGSRAATTDRDSAKVIGQAQIHIYGILNDFVLVDPLGRVDEQSDSTLVTDIPGCSRWPGGLEHELDDPDSSYKDLMLFLLEQCIPGEYKLMATAEDSTNVRVNVVFERADGMGGECPSVERIDRVPPGHALWTLEVTDAPPKDGCNVTIRPFVTGKPKSRH